MSPTLSTTLVSISICVILPVAIVLIHSIAEYAKEEQKAKILIKAIEANNIDTNKLADSLCKRRKTARQTLATRLLRGCIFSLVGLFVCIVGFVNLCTGYGFCTDSVTVPLLFGGASLAVGISYLIVYFVTRRQPDETAAE